MTLTMFSEGVLFNYCGEFSRLMIGCRGSGWVCKQKSKYCSDLEYGTEKLTLPLYLATLNYINSLQLSIKIYQVERDFNQTFLITQKPW